jgi:hypothetical protein
MDSDNVARLIALTGLLFAILYKRTGPEGPQGATGPQGPGSTVSAFATINGGTINLTNTYANIVSTTITTTTTGYIMGQCSFQIVNTDNEDHVVDFYLVVNGSTSNISTEDVRKITSGIPGYANLFIIHRCPSVAAGTHNLQLWGRYSSGGSPAAGELVVDHADLSALGNLS